MLRRRGRDGDQRGIVQRLVRRDARRLPGRRLLLSRSLLDGLEQPGKVLIQVSDPSAVWRIDGYGPNPTRWSYQNMCPPGYNQNNVVLSEMKEVHYYNPNWNPLTIVYCRADDMSETYLKMVFDWYNTEVLTFQAVGDGVCDEALYNLGISGEAADC